MSLLYAVVFASRCRFQATVENRGEHSAVAMILDIQAPQLLADNPNDGEARYCLGVAYLDGADYRGKPRYRNVGV